VVEELVADHQNQRATRGLGYQLFGLRTVQTQGLLYEHMPASLQRGTRQREVAFGWGADGDSLDPIVAPELIRLRATREPRIVLGDPLPSLLSDVTHRNDPRITGETEVTEYVRTPTADTDYGDAQILSGGGACHFGRSATGSPA
jgi:hypothetical protein